MQDMEASLQLSLEDVVPPVMEMENHGPPARYPPGNVVGGTESAAGKPKIDFIHQRQDERNESRWARKNEYQPPVEYLLRNAFIFDPRAEFTLRGTNPGSWPTWRSLWTNSCVAQS